MGIAIEQMEEKLKAVQKMQSDVMKFTDGNAKQVQKIQSEWSDAIKMGKAKGAEKKKVEKKDPSPNGITQQPGKSKAPKSQLASIGDKGSSVKTPKAPKTKSKKVPAPEKVNTSMTSSA